MTAALHPAVAVAGPTASGKSALAQILAARFQGEIVNCDSMQVYRGFDIGTAKAPAAADRGHLFDIFGPLELCSAGDYSRRAREAMREIAGRGRLPVICGGAGFYLRALLGGLFAGPERDERLRGRLNRRPSSHLHRLLARLDREAAARIHPHDNPKLIRAIEVCLHSRRPMTEVWAGGSEPLSGFRVLKLGLDPPRAHLYAAIDQRARAMFESGLVEEVRALLDAGVPETAKPFEAPGYTEALEVLRGTLSRASAVERTAARTRQYAKRQMTWFRREKDMVWLAGFGGQPEIVEAACLRVEDYLRSR